MKPAENETATGLDLDEKTQLRLYQNCAGAANRFATAVLDSLERVHPQEYRNAATWLNSGNTRLLVSIDEPPGGPLVLSLHIIPIEYELPTPLFALRMDESGKILH